MNMQDITIIRREVGVTVVPHGHKMDLMPGQEVLVTQAKGGSFTLNVSGNLVHLDGKDADAIGKEVIKMPVDDKDIKIGDEIDKDLVWAQMSTVYDPEIPVNIVELGLIYDVGYTKLKDEGYHVGIQMTLTAPGCGMGPVLVANIEERVLMIPNVTKVDVVLLFDPPWHSDLMSEDAKLVLGLF